MKYNRTFQALAIPIVNVYDHLKYNYHVIGREKVPDGGCVLVANHTQWADPVLVGTALGNQYPLVAMAKKSCFKSSCSGRSSRRSAHFRLTAAQRTSERLKPHSKQSKRERSC